MFKINKTLRLFLVLILGFFIGSLFSLKVDVKTLVAQTSNQKYTVFKTENEGFKFYKIWNQQKFWAPLFAQTPTTTSDKNQVATKEYVDSKITTGGMDIRYYENETCYNPAEEMVIGGTDSDSPYIGGDPSGREVVNQEKNRFIYADRGYFIRKYPIGLENTKWVACLKVPSNPVVGYVVTPGSAVDYSSNASLKIGACDFTENYNEYSAGLKRNFFKRPCSWTLTTADGFTTFKIKSTRDFSLRRDIKKPIKYVTLDLYSNDGGLCLMRFKTPENFILELAITRGARINSPGVTPASLPRDFNFDSDSLILYGDDAGYSEVGPLALTNDSFNFSGNWSYKILGTRQQGGDWYVIRAFKPFHMSIENSSDFWNLVNAIEMFGKGGNGSQWGANICKLVLWFE